MLGKSRVEFIIYLSEYIRFLVKSFEELYIRNKGELEVDWVL